MGAGTEVVVGRECRLLIVLGRVDDAERVFDGFLFGQVVLISTWLFYRACSCSFINEISERLPLGV